MNWLEEFLKADDPRGVVKMLPDGASFDASKGLAAQTACIVLAVERMDRASARLQKVAIRVALVSLLVAFIGLCIAIWG